MKYIIKNRQEKIIYRFLILTLIISGINGVLIDKLHVKNTPVGIIYRTIFMIYLVYIFLKMKKINTLKVVLMILYCAISITYAYLAYNGTLYSMGFDMEQYLRVILTLLIAAPLIYLVKNDVINGGLIYKVMQDSTKVLIVIYVVGLLFNLGTTTYKAAGYKSVFNANNGLNITVIVLFVFQMERAFNTRKKIDYLYVMALMIILILLGSKSSFIFIGFYFILRMLFEKNIKKLIKILFIILIATGVTYYIVKNLFYNQFVEIMQHQTRLFQKENLAGSLMTYFLSGRNVFLGEAIAYVKNHINILSILLGVGNYNIQMHIGTAMTGGFATLKNIEMDFFDILFGNGIIGIMISYGYSLKIFFSNVKRILIQKKYGVFISFICMMIFSFTGGHVYTDSMGSTFLGMVLVLLVEKNSIKEVR